MSIIIGLLLATLFCFGACSELGPEFSNMYMAYKDDIENIEERFPLKTKLVESSNKLSSQVIFYLYKRGTDFYDILSLGDIAGFNHSNFDTKKPTKVLIHGWMDYVHGPMISAIKEGYLKGSEDVNILAVDWGDISINVDYIATAMETRKVGVYVAAMLDFLVANGANLDSFHVIGHSLGAHVAGEIGNSLTTGKLPRITGLDAALPGFEVLKIARKLEKSDAEFVDCIHTCGGMLGILDPFCHADFYPNGGMFVQPGCSAIDFGKCSHFRAFDFFAESILPNHEFPSLYCQDITSHARNCVESSYLMGNSLDNVARGTFYAYTNSKFPFAPIRNQ